MAKGNVYPYKSAHILNFKDFVVGEERVKKVGIAPGQPGFVILLIELEPCDDCPEAPTEYRFMVHPSQLVFEMGQPVEIDIPDEKPAAPTLVVPRHIAERGG